MKAYVIELCKHVEFLYPSIKEFIVWSYGYCLGWVQCSVQKQNTIIEHF